MSQWDRVQANIQDMEKIWSMPRSFAGDVWFRFHKKPTALAGFLMVVLLLGFALLGPLFSSYSYSDQSLALANIPPILSVCEAPNGNYLYITPAMKVIQIGRDGKLMGQLTKIKDDDSLRRISYAAGRRYGGLPRLLRKTDRNAECGRGPNPCRPADLEQKLPSGHGPAGTGYTHQADVRHPYFPAGGIYRRNHQHGHRHSLRRHCGVCRGTYGLYHDARLWISSARSR